MTATMRAVVLDAPGPPEGLRIRELPVPEPRPGWVLIRIRAFGVNRSELHTRLGLAQGVTFPRVLGIEATGVVAAAPRGEFEEGQQVATMMGGMGRTLDGGYAEFTSVPATQVIPFRSELDWATLGAIPEMVQTTHGSLTVGLDALHGQPLLTRGGRGRPPHRPDRPHVRARRDRPGACRHGARTGDGQARRPPLTPATADDHHRLLFRP